MNNSEKIKKPIDSQKELDWSLMTDDSPDVTIKDNNKIVNHGIKFENLIEKLLYAMFAGEDCWHRTQETNDGKKDFFRYINGNFNEQEWAECKNYANNLSINILSPTMVMAALENIKTVYFFSRSPLNYNAVESVVRYSQTTGKKVYIIDGKLLEAYIVKYWQKPEIRKFFASQAENFDVNLFFKNTPQLQIIKQIKDLQGNRIHSGKIFSKGETFKLGVILRNISTTDTDYKITITQSSDKIKFENAVDNKTCIERGHLAPGLTRELVYTCNALSAGVERFNAKIEYGKKSEFIKYKIEISEEAFNLWTNSSALEKYDSCKKHLETFNRKPIVICGAEGTGKSTLLSILIQENEINSGYRIISVENNLSRNQIFQSVLFKSIGASTELAVPTDQLEEEAFLTCFMLDNYVKSDKEFAKAVMRVYDYNAPFLFIFDDADKISRNHRDIIRALVRESKSENKPIYFIFTVNDDENNGLDVFLNNIGWGDLYESTDVNDIHLEKFKKTDVINCLKLGYGLNELDYAFENFDRTVSPRDVRDFIKDLKKQNIIYHNNKHQFVIYDKNKFKKAVQTSLYADKAFRELCYNLNDTSKFVMKFLLIAEIMSQDVRNNYQTAVSELLEIGLIKYECENVIIANDNFVKSIKKHFEYIEEDYADIYATDSVDRCAKVVCALNLISHKQKEKAEFLNSFFLSPDNMRPSKRYEIYSLICDKFPYIKELDLALVALNFIKCNLPYFSKEQGHDSTYALYAKIAEMAIICNWDEKNSIVIMAELLKKVLDRALSTYHNKECYGFAMSFIDKINIAQNMNERDKSYWLSHYFNRAAIAAERGVKLSDFEKRYHYSACELYAKSKEYCEAAGNPDELLLQMNVDEFNHHYVYSSSLTFDIILRIKREIYNLKADNIKRKQCFDYHKILYDYLAVRLNVFDGKKSDIIEELYLKTDNLLSTQIENSPFYMAKLYLLKVYLLIEKEQYNLADKTITEALDYVYLNELRRAFFKFMFVRAQLADIIDKTNMGKEKKLNAAVLSLKQFFDINDENKTDNMRDIYVAVELLTFIYKNTDNKFVRSLIDSKDRTQCELWDCVCGKNKESKFFKTSYFCYNGIQFPTI